MKLFCTSCHVSGLDASHADGDRAALLRPRLHLHHSLQSDGVRAINVATAVVIHTRSSEAVAERP